MSDIIHSKNTENLGKTSQLIYDYIISFMDEHGYPPTIREIMAYSNIKSTSTIFYHLTRMQKLGLIKRYDAKNRAIEVVGRNTASRGLIKLPVVGKVSAGVPILAVENISDTIEFPDSIFSGSSLFLLRVKGDSMINAGILNGDLIAVNKQDDADNGEIVVAMIDDEVTVKRFYRENDHIRLQPENDAYMPIISSNVSIIGKVVGLIRDSL